MDFSIWKMSSTFFNWPQHISNKDLSLNNDTDVWLIKVIGLKYKNEYHLSHPCKYLLKSQKGKKRKK